MAFDCCDKSRRDLVAASPDLNGIDYLEVFDRDQADPVLKQRTLFVFCLKEATALTASNVEIAGGDRITSIKVQSAEPASAPPLALNSSEQSFVNGAPDKTKLLVVRLDQAGDFSTYSLKLVSAPGSGQPPAHFDPRLSQVDFSFKVECPSDFDCQPPAPDCPPATAEAPEINYMVKDYPGFRGMILERLSQLVPGWAPSSEADLGVVLSEAVAYAADYLSYQQDAVATEAYLQTARRRVSLRRHALLVDYRVSDGCNARTWIQVKASSDGAKVRRATDRFYTRLPGLPSFIEPGSGDEIKALNGDCEIFEPLHDLAAYPAHDQISLYTWGDGRCCLAAGSTDATLKGSFPDLTAGDFLLFEEVLGPTTGNAADADPAHRQVVRLTQASTGNDPLNGQAITEVAWAQEDALGFPLCVSARLASGGAETGLEDVSVARGNLLLADHGYSWKNVEDFQVPEPTLTWAAAPTGDRCNPAVPDNIPPRFNPTLTRGPVTQQVAFPTVWDPAAGVFRPDPSLPASGVMDQEPSQALAAVSLSEISSLDPVPPLWMALPDLLECGEMDLNFVVEVEADGSASLRFGDGSYGARPEPGAQFSASYRMGNGTAGNIGADAVGHVTAADPHITGARNPLPGTGGQDPETMDQIRRRAPQAFRTQERAVTEQDYADLVGADSRVEKAEAQMRWTGSWHTVFISVDPKGSEALSPGLQAGLSGLVEKNRMACQDFDFRLPQYVSLELGLRVWVSAGYFRAHVEEGLLAALGSKALPNGQKGAFYPDNFTFGQTVYLSPLIAAARGVAGVDRVQVVTFQRQGTPTNLYLSQGKMPMGQREVARMLNDPDYPERGILNLELMGGK